METKNFQLFQACRNNILKLINPYSEKELNAIPKNYKNNLIWNAGHCLVTQQLLVYYLSGNKMQIPMEWVDLFKKGTRPESELDSDMMAAIRTQLKVSSEKLEEDYTQNLFTEYKPYMTSFGFALNTIEDAIAFNNLHESLHLGYMMALKNEL